MFNHLFVYFHEELAFQKEKKELDENNKQRNRFMYSLVILFLFLLICSFFNII